MIKEITTKDFQEKVFDFSKEKNYSKGVTSLGERSTIVECYTSWCSPCKAYGEILEQVAVSTDVDVYKVDAETETALTEYFKIRSLPFTVFVGKSGRVMTANGLLKKTAVEGLLEDVSR